MNPTFKEEEDQLYSSLELLTKEINSLIDSKEVKKDELLSLDCKDKIKNDEKNNNNIKFVYCKLKCLAQDAHKSIFDFGLKIELGLLIDNNNFDNDDDDGNGNNILSNEKRKELKEIGRDLWMTIRSHPEYFRDVFLSTTTTTNKKGSKKKKNENNSCEEEEQNTNQAIASGYIRAIAARLILIDHINTRNSYYPTLGNYIDCFVSSTTDNEVSSDIEEDDDDENVKESKAQCNTIKKMKIEDIHLPSKSEIEFGIKSFVRAGRSLLTHSSDPESAYINLNLAKIFWFCAKEKNYIEILKSNIDDGFDSFALLPEAASLFVTTKTKDSTNNIINQQKQPMIINSISHISMLLLNASNFIDDITNAIIKEEEESDDNNKFNNSRIHSLRLHRFLPSLARIGYKHGNRFARLKDFIHAKQVLKIALKATDKCIADIRNDYLAVETSSVVTVLEQEMISVSKECFYVLSHVFLSIGKNIEAKKCLDQIESYLDEQRNRDDELFKETMNRVDDGNSGNDSSSQQLNFSEIALEGPKKQDMADIKARAITARSKARHCEDKERANLIFSRIMIEHRSSIIIQSSYPSHNDIEQETFINMQLKKLIDISFKLSGNNNKSSNGISLVAGSSSCCNTVVSSTLINSMDNDTFYLALVATRLVHIRILSALVQQDENNTNDDNTYDLLKHNYSKNHPKYLLISLDELNSTIILLKSNVNGIKLLNDRGLKVVDNFVKDCLECLKSLKSNEDDNGILVDNTIHQAIDSFINLLHDSKAHCMRAIELYREMNTHEICIKYCDYCLEIVSIIESASKKKSSSIRSSSENNEDSDNLKYFMADIMSIKAYSLTKSKQYMRGKVCARDAWDKGLSKPRVYNMAILFHCTVAHEIRDIAQDSQQLGSTGVIETPVSNSLLELDNAIKHLTKQNNGGDNNTNGESIEMDVILSFPFLESICKEYEDNGEGLILLGVQERWIAMLARSKFIKEHFYRKNGMDCSQEYFAKHSVLSLLYSYLSHVEALISCKDILFTVNNVLDTVMSLLCSIREYKKQDEKEKLSSKKRKKSKQSENEKLAVIEGKEDGTTIIDDDETNSPNLIWDDELIIRIIGRHSDCVMIAEQLWNLAVITMTADNNQDTPINKTSPNCKCLPSELFAHAHDFALLSEEEEGECLTKGKLDYDIRHTIDDETALAHIIKEVDNSNACELSSEFSAQCLLLSASNSVDYIYFDEVKGISKEMNSKTRQSLKYSICRLKRAKQEFLINYENEEKTFDQLYLDKLYSWLFLRLLIEICDDEDCSRFLQTENILNVFSSPKGIASISSNMEQDSIRNSNNTPCITALDNDTIISYLYLCSQRAGVNNLHVTSRYLLHFCSKELVRGNKSQIKLEGNNNDESISLGKIQVRLLEKSSTVGQVLDIFKEIEKSVVTSTKKNERYALAEMDWFAVEAYNRGLALSYVGDSNAQDLLAIALNILPNCGKEVQTYGQLIRKAYHDTMDRAVSGNTTGPMSTEKIVGLFTGMP